MSTLVDGHLDGCVNGLDGEVIVSTDHFGGLSRFTCASGSKLFP
jgi:hypothetical protein